MLVFATTVLAKKTKYTFNDVVIDEQTVEIEASVKDNNNNDFSECSYFSDDYADYLGQYADDVIPGDTAEDVLDFCVANFDNKTE
jgi:hypothetical protein